MVLGMLAGGLAGLALAGPTGLAFGYGYGYGVRQGYSAFKPPSKTANDLKLSANPVTGAAGAGLQSAEEHTDVKTPVGTLTPEPSLIAESAKMSEMANPQETYKAGGYYTAPNGKIRLKSSFKTKEELDAWIQKNSKKKPYKYGAHSKYT